MQSSPEQTVSRRNLLQGDDTLARCVASFARIKLCSSFTTGVAGLAVLSSGALNAFAGEAAKKPAFVKLESGVSYQEKVKNTGPLANLEQAVAAVIYLQSSIYVHPLSCFIQKVHAESKSHRILC